MRVSRETSARLVEFADALHKWNPAINLVSASTLPCLWERHIQDSAQLYDHLEPDTHTWLDIGSGAGFPGLIVAILAADHGSDLEVRLVESDGRKAAFLRQMIQTLSLSTIVHHQRIELLPPQGADVVSARAYGPLTNLCGIAEKHLSMSGKALFLKGESYPSEIEAARRHWSFDINIIPSITNPSSAILELSALTKV